MTSTNNTKKNLSVVYSFEGRGEGPLRRGEISVFFRKRRPIKLPDKVFFYIGVPVKSIVGFSTVGSITEVSLEEAKLFRNDGAITENELIEYIGHNGTVHAIRIGKPVLFDQPKRLSDLNAKFGFNPPQSFSILEASFEGALVGSAE
jgi:predicted transcriptional regulator